MFYMHFQLVKDLGKQQKSTEVFLEKYFKSTFKPSKILSKLYCTDYKKIITKIYCLHSQGRSHENEKLKNKSNNKNHRHVYLDLFYSRAKRLFLFFYVIDPTFAR